MDPESRSDLRTRPLLSVRRAIALSPRSFYRYVTKTLGVDRLADSGRIDDLRNVHYVHNLFETLLTAIQQDTRDASLALPHVLRMNGCDDLLRTFLRDQQTCGTGELRRRTVSMLECLGRAAGVDLDSTGVGSGCIDTTKKRPGTVIEDDRFPARALPKADHPLPRANHASLGTDHAPRPATQAVLPVVLYIPHLRSPYNLGGMIRTAAAFGLAGVVVGKETPDLEHPRVVRAAMGGGEYIPVKRGTVDDAWNIVTGDSSKGLIALETGGSPLPRFTFPRSGVLIAGHEELGISSELLAAVRTAQNGGIVTVPHYGPKASLNVGVAVGIALSWWNAALTEGRSSSTPD